MLLICGEIKLHLNLFVKLNNIFVVHPKMNTGKEPFKCGMRPSSLPSSLRYDAASCFDAARRAESAPI
jgi:hypothetical protein